MRFEGKHNFFKDVAHRLKCYRNIEKSMAERHQLYSSYISMSGINKKTLTGFGKYKIIVIKLMLLTLYSIKSTGQ